MNKISITALLLVFTGGVLSAQDFDLSSQRSEKQDVLAVPGRKVEHDGIIINPTPQYLNVRNKAAIQLAEGVHLQDKQQKFFNDIPFLKQSPKGIRLTVDYGEKKAVKKGVKAISGAYILSIDRKKGISIMGYDERGAFYGLQTLRQLVENGDGKKGLLPELEINDYPNLPNRGVVEGFYGTPWSHKVRMSLIDFYGKFKMNTYLYGPKDDPYHSSPNWRLPYPEKEAADLKELIQACQRNRVDFVWAIHPGQDIKWNEEDYGNLVKKFNLMYDLGVRSFAVFFDDISGDGTNPVKQTELLNRLTTDFVKAKGDVTPLTVCPTDYSKLWANPTPQGSLAIYGNTLDKDIKVFWTGDVVCSDVTKETLDWVNNRIKRPAYFWWNFPVTDYVRHIILQGPAYGLETSLTADDLSGIVSNPMEHGEASKLALYGVADYAWNIGKYNAMDNWERGLKELASDVSDIYRTFAIHSADTENGYRRDESWETTTFRINDFTEEQSKTLWNEFDKVEKAQGQLDKGLENRMLYGELKPWLDEFTKLGARGKRALDLMEMYRQNADAADFWQHYLSNQMTKADRDSYNAHKSGTMKLQPFYENAMDDMGLGFMTRLLGKQPISNRGIGSFATSQTPMTKLMFDNDSTTFYTSGIGQKNGDWIGVDLGSVQDVSEISILQGRNSVNDVDYFDHALLEYSADGHNWVTLLDGLKQQYVINWKGESVKARYVRLRRLDSKRTNYAAIRSFDINPMRVESIGFCLFTETPSAWLSIFDKRLDTKTVLDGRFAFEVVQPVDSYTLLLDRKAPLTIRQYDKKGKAIESIQTEDAFVRLKVHPSTTKLEIEGQAGIVEILPIR